MGKFSVTTPDRSTVNLEKTFSLEDAKSVLKTEKMVPKNSIKVMPEEKKAPENTNNPEKTEIVNVPDISPEAIQLINALMHTQNHIVQELTEVFDRRFEKFDEIVMDLIRCKTENERLKNKVDNLTRDNYKLKKDVECYKSIIPGIYIKKESDKIKF